MHPKGAAGGEGHTNVPWHIPFFCPEEEKFRMIPMGSRILLIRNAECERHDGSGQEMIWGKGSETMEKSYEKVIEYVKKGIGSGEIQAGEKLLPERELAQKLEISRNSAREGLRILENMGVLESQQGAGNYVSGNFDEILAEMLSFMFILKKIDVDKITEFRSTLEWGALESGVRQATAEQREKMMTYLENLENAETEEERVRWDKAIHYLLIEADGNLCMIANYKALNKIMDEYIPKMRGKIIEGMHSEQFLSRAHRTLAEGFAEGNIEKAREGLKLHFHYIYQYM